MISDKLVLNFDDIRFSLSPAMLKNTIVYQIAIQHHRKPLKACYIYVAIIYFFKTKFCESNIWYTISGECEMGKYQENKVVCVDSNISA